MELICYPLLNNCSRRAIRRKRGKWGHLYKYRPRGVLLERLSQQLGWSKESVRQQLYRERAYLLEEKRANSLI